jgi:hypothetical protein
MRVVGAAKSATGASKDKIRGETPDIIFPWYLKFIQERANEANRYGNHEPLPVAGVSGAIFRCSAGRSHRQDES